MRVRCPHCHNAIEVVPDASLELLTCPSCGSHLDFLNETLTHRTEEPRTVGHFVLQELVGLGHFGEVWMARDTQLDRTVAVKIPRTKELTRASVELFRREAVAAAQLRHPHIVSVHEVGRDADTLYIVSDFIRGVTLANYITEHRYAPRDAAALCATVAEALHHAHEAGVVHRDLKPGNIMLDGENRPHLTDFGLAKREAGEATVTADGKILGTPAYMSPEQARGEGHQADRKSDVYSLGVILYEMLTGERPFKGDTQLLLHQVQFEEPRPPRKRDPRVPRELETICLKALAKRPERRYATAQEMAADLHRYLRGEPIAAKRVSHVERVWRWGRRNRFKASAAVVVTVLISLLAAASWRNHVLSLGPPPVLRTVHIASEPPGAEMVFIPIDEETGEPNADARVRAKTAPTVTIALRPGNYLVVARIANVGFHEVYRLVPDPDSRLYPHNAWKTLPDGEVEFTAITIRPIAEITRKMAFCQGGEFTMGRDDLELPAHIASLEPFWLDQHEVTAGEYRRLVGGVPDSFTEHFAAADERWPISFVDFDRALRYAELAGKRLMKEAEYEFVATGGGRRESPSGTAIDEIDEWPLDVVDGPALDRTPDDPPLVGLFSNVAEWTDSFNVPYPGARRAPAFLKELIRQTRVVRGGPPSVVNGRPKRSEWLVGPRVRHAMVTTTEESGLGIRCALSAKPRFLDD